MLFLNRCRKFLSGLLTLFALASIGISQADANLILIEEDFETGRFSQNWFWVGFPGVISTSAERSFNGRYAAKIVYDAVEEEGKLSLEQMSPGHKEIWARWYVYFAPGFDFPNGLKLSRARGGNSDSHFNFDGGMELQFRNTKIHFKFNQWSKSMNQWTFSWPEGDQGYNPEARIFETGRWYCLRTHYKLNSPGVKDGIAQLWIDDRLLINASNFDFRGSYADNFGVFWIGGNYSANTTERSLGFPRTPSVVYVDDVVISTVNVGCLPGSADKTPPSRPSGLRVTSP